MNEKAHTGQILKKAVSNSGMKIAELARKIGRSRRFIYTMFDKQDVPLHYIIKIGEIINYDFFKDNNFNNNDIPHLYQKNEYWKDKYLKLLEEYNELLKLHYGNH